MGLDGLAVGPDQRPKGTRAGEGLSAASKRSRMSPKLPAKILCLVTDRSLTGGEDGLVIAVQRAVEGGVNMVQLREKDLAHADLTRLARWLRVAIGGEALIIVNGDARAALVGGADGVQLPEGGQSVTEARAIMGDDALIGCSVHSLTGALKAQRAGADFLILGTVFPSKTHPAGETIGVDGVRIVTSAVRGPIIAIGGIVVQNAREVIKAGACGVAVISAVLGAADRQQAAKSLAYEIRTVNP